MIIFTKYHYSIRIEPENACAPIESKPIESEPIESEPIKSEARYDICTLLMNYWQNDGAIPVW